MRVKCLTEESFITGVLKPLHHSASNLIILRTKIIDYALVRLLNYTMTDYHHHHHERAPSWSVAVSTSCLHRSLSWANRHAKLSPWLSCILGPKPGVTWTSWAESPVLGQPTNRRL